MRRVILAAGVTGVAAAFAIRGDWTPAVLASASVILAAAFWVYGAMVDTRAMMRQAVPQPEPVLRPVTPPRPAKPCRPPWLTAPMPLVPAEPEPDYERPVARWQQEARVR